jgi:hypothetical protein
MLDTAVTAFLWLWLAEAVALAAVVVAWAGRIGWRRCRAAWPVVRTEAQRRCARGRARAAVV